MGVEAEGRIHTLAMRDGAELYCRRWEVPSPRGAVVAVHGIRSHSGWYLASCAHLAAAGYEVVFPDRRGAGMNRTSRGDVTDWRVLVDDLREFIDDVRRRHPDVPVHLEAVSWGARVACAACLRHPEMVDSLMLVGPGLVSRVESRGLRLRTAAALLLLRPRKLLAHPLQDPGLFTDNPERIAYVRDDPLSLRQCTARFFFQTHRLDRFVRRHAGELRVPLRVMLAGRDRIVDNDAVRRLVARFTSRPKEIVEYPQASHTLEFEPKPSPIFADMVRWLDARSRTGC